jgi:hypothetical protein
MLLQHVLLVRGTMISVLREWAEVRATQLYRARSRGPPRCDRTQRLHLPSVGLLPHHPLAAATQREIRTAARHARL